MSNVLREVFEAVFATVFFLVALISIVRMGKYSTNSDVLESLSQKTQVHTTFDVGDNKTATSRYDRLDRKEDYRTGEDIIAEILETYETRTIYINGSKVNKALIKAKGAAGISVGITDIYKTSSYVGDVDDNKKAIETNVTYYEKVH